MAINFFSINGTGGGGGGGGAVNTANGISGNGTVGTPVILGGNPLNQDTDLALNGHLLSIDDTQGENLLFVAFQAVGITLDFKNTTSNALASVSIGSSSSPLNSKFELSVDDGTVNTKRLEVDSAGGLGLLVADEIDNIGLNGEVLFPVSGNPEQYAQYGNIPGAGTTKFAQSGLSNNTDLIVFNTDPAVDQAYTITAALFVTFGLDSVQLQVEYTSFDTTVRTANMGAAMIATGDAQYPPLTLICLANTTITVKGVVSGTSSNYSVIGNIVPIGGF